MAVHVLIQQKGGVGKSTLAMNLAAVKNDLLTDKGDAQEKSPVLVASVDPQGSAIWWGDRVDDLPFQTTKVENAAEIAQLPNLPGIDHVYLDTPGWLGERPGEDGNDGAASAIYAALEIADLAIVPITTEGLSFDPATRTIEKVLKPRKIPFVVVINAWEPRDSTLERDETIEFVDGMGWPRAKRVVRKYKVHSRGAVDGRVCTQYDASRTALQAREDMMGLGAEIAERF